MALEFLYTIAVNNFLDNQIEEPIIAEEMEDLSLSSGNIAAFCEELIFRFPLVSKYSLSALSFIVPMGLHSLIPPFNNHTDSEINKESTGHYNTIVKDIEKICVLGAIPHLFLKHTRFNTLTLPLLIISTSTSFGLVHVHNYKEINSSSLIYTLANQFVGGLLLTYIAIRFGLRYSILQHASWNTIVIFSDQMVNATDESNIDKSK